MKKVYKAKKGFFKVLAVILVLAFVLPSLAAAADWIVISNTLMATVKVVEDTHVAMIEGDKPQYFETLQDAVDAATGGSKGDPVKIKLLKNIDVQNAPEQPSDKRFIKIEGKHIELNLNGKTITSDGRAIEVHSGSLIIDNGTIEKTSGDTSAAVVVYGHNEQTVNEVTYVKFGKNATVIANYGIAVFDRAGKYADGVTIEFYGTLTYDDKYAAGHAFHVDGDIKKTGGKAPTILISGATVQSKGVGVASNGYCNIEIVNSDITGATAVEVKAGDVTIDSATTLTGDVADPTQKPNYNGSSTKGFSIAVVANKSYSKDANDGKHVPIKVSVAAEMDKLNGPIALLRDSEDAQHVVEFIFDNDPTEKLVKGNAVKVYDTNKYQVVDGQLIDLKWEAENDETDNTLTLTATVNVPSTATFTASPAQGIIKAKDVSFILTAYKQGDGNTWTRIDDSAVTITVDGEPVACNTEEDNNPFWYIAQESDVTEDIEMTIGFTFNEPGTYEFELFAVQEKDYTFTQPGS